MKKKLDCILLIDDDEPTNFLNRLTIEQSGCARHVQVAQGGQEALDFLLHRDKYAQTLNCPQPELIFLDINMPAMDGWEFLEKYRQLLPTQKAGVVLVMLTTSLNPDDEVRAIQHPEVAGFENKPLREGQLEEVLKRYFPDHL